MRPRHKAAENHAVDLVAILASLRASMRPRHKAAENEWGSPHNIAHHTMASMRPRHKAAENLDMVERKVKEVLASMRPRHKAAENSTRDSGSHGRIRFNEAAA